MTRHEKLLGRMRRANSGWRLRDFRTLYSGFGFEETDIGKHTNYRHPRFPTLWTTVPRSSPLSKRYAEDAVSMIDELRRLEEGR